MSNFKGIPVIVLTAVLLSINISPANAQTYSGIDYGKTGNAYQKLDIYMPATGAKPYPVVVWIHGGGFSGGSRTEGNASQLAGLLGPRGAAVVSIDYRLSGAAQWPAQSQDCKAAIRWIRANASTYNFDPNRIGVAGGSAGGHLSEFVGVTGDIGSATSGTVTMDLEGAIGGTSAFSSKVQAALPMYGLSDFLTLNDACPQNNPTISSIDHDAANSPESMLMGGLIQNIKDKCTLASPLHFVSPDDPPFCILHGNRDASVPVCQSITFAAAMRTAFSTNKKECQFIQYPTFSHGFSVSSCGDTIRAFFTRNLINLKTGASGRGIDLPQMKPSIFLSGNSLIVSTNVKADLIVINVLGRVVLSRFFSGPLNSYAIDLKSLGQGAFFAMLRTANNTMCSKMTIIR
jgi:acetyl esterase/lipase